MAGGGNPQKKVSIYKVAEAAGVSYGTVSRALNNRPDVSPETRRRVLEVAKQLGYVPDPIARGLSMKLTSAFGILVPGITDPFFMPIAQGVEQAAWEIGYATLLHDTGRSTAAMLAGVATFMHFRVSGVVILGGAQDLDEQIAGQLAGIPTVVVLRKARHDLFPAVYFDHAAGARAAVAHLLATGRQRIGFVGGADGSVAAQERWRGYCEALAAAGRPIDPTLVVQGHFTMEGAADGTKALIALPPSRRPDALFYASDTMALAGMHQLHQAGIRIPADMAVAGYGNVSFAAISEPPLTTVDVAKGRLGHCAGLLLKQMLEHPDQRPDDVTLGTALIVRASSAQE